jgi:hypothetical protein
MHAFANAMRGYMGNLQPSLFIGPDRVVVLVVITSEDDGEGELTR